MKTTEILMLEFKEGTKIRRVRLPNPRKDLTKEEVLDVMDEIANNKFFEHWYDIKPKGAKVVKTTSQDIGIVVE